MASCFDNLFQGTPIETTELYEAYCKDPSTKKVTLTIGTYRNEEGKLWTLPIVRKVEKLIAENDSLDKNYLPIFGLEIFTTAATALLLGKTNEAITSGKAFGIQTLSGTGALKIGATFLKTRLNRNFIYVSNPSWDNHVFMFEDIGFKHVKAYRYWDKNNKCFDFGGMCEDLNNAPENAIILLHACGHNPSGIDPTQKQWIEISKIMKKRKLFPFFDCAYQGLVTGCTEEDPWVVRQFANDGHELFCAQSFSKNFGLYGERVGNLTVIVNNKENLGAVKWQFQKLIRAIYLSPPTHGALIVATILNTPEYYEEWKNCIQSMCARMADMRQKFQISLEMKTQIASWKHITDQKGMFCYTGIPVEVVEILRNRYHIYLMRSGRVNVSSLNMNNLEYVTDSIAETLKEMNICI